MLQSTIDIAVIVVNWGKANMTVNAINSIKHKSEITVKIIVADNGSADNSIDLLKKLPDIDLLSLDKNYGFAVGNNIAVRYAIDKYKPKYLFLLNNDILAKKETVDKLYENRGKADILCPKIYSEDGKTIWACGGDIVLWKAFAKNRGQGELDIGQYQSITDIDFASGCAIWIKSNVVNEIGLFDPRYQFYYEDVDFCIRSQKKGFSLKYIPNSEIIHLVGKTAGNEYSLSQSYFRWRNRLIFANKNMAVMPRFIFIVFLLPFILVRDTYRYLKKGLGKELFAAYKGLWSIVNVRSRQNDK